jgi:hypothetical protein
MEVLGRAGGQYGMECEAVLLNRHGVSVAPLALHMQYVRIRKARRQLSPRNPSYRLTRSFDIRLFTTEFFVDPCDTVFRSYSEPN